MRNALIPKLVFQKLERRYQVGQSTSRKFTFRKQFTFFAFFQLAGQKSMRSALRSLTSLGKKLYHFVLEPIALSSLSDANNTRPVAFFKDLFGEMFQLCRPHALKHKFRFKSPLYSMDASTISLCLSLFPWAKHRKNKGGVKLHTKLDHAGYIPAFVCITEAKVHDIKAGQDVKFPKKSIVVLDKGYSSYKYFQSLTQNEIYFVTRQKTNARYKVVERQTVKKKLGVTSDQIIEVQIVGETLRLRRVGYKDPITGKHYKFLTNRFDLSAKTIAEIYKDRWQIELFFKEIKQSLKIKKFVGNSENAVLIQIYTAFTIYLLFAYQKFISKSKLSVQQILELINVNLLEKLNIEILLKPPSKQNEISKNSYKNSMLSLIA